MSDAATCIDIEMDVASLAEGTATLKKVKWFIPSAPSLKSYQLVAGFQHVDDALVASKICCEECLLNGVRKLWPEDVGVSLEGSGTNIPFLHVDVEIFNDNNVYPMLLVPAAPNRDFARGTDGYPSLSKLASFFHRDFQPPAILRKYVSVSSMGLIRYLKGE